MPISCPPAQCESWQAATYSWFCKSFTLENVGHEVIVHILASCMPWKEVPVAPRLVIQQLLLFANPAVPDLLGARVDDEATLT
jgi:hypothetical protein